MAPHFRPPVSPYIPRPPARPTPDDPPLPAQAVTVRPEGQYDPLHTSVARAGALTGERIGARSAFVAALGARALRERPLRRRRIATNKNLEAAASVFDDRARDASSRRSLCSALGVGARTSHALDAYSLDIALPTHIEALSFERPRPSHLRRTNLLEG